MLSNFWTPPALVATGIPLPQKPRFVGFPPLVAHGLAQLGTPPSGLEIRHPARVLPERPGPTWSAFVLAAD